LWCARFRGKALAQSFVTFVLTSATFAATVVVLGGWEGLGRMFNAMSFQFTRSSPHTLWSVVGQVPLQQLAEAATLALIVGAGLRLRRDPALAEDRSRVAAIAGAVLLGLQISANYWNYMYLVWILPFLLVSILDVDAVRSGRGAHTGTVKLRRVHLQAEPLTPRVIQPM
jgi:hypothetical protein